MNPSCSLSSEVSQLLELAFPPVKCASQVVYDLVRAELEPVMQQIQDRYKNISWKELSPDMIVRPIDTIYLLTDEAFFKMLPAYLSAAIAPDSESFNQDARDAIFDIVMFSIPLTGEEPEDCLVKDDWWRSLSQVQRTAVHLAIVTIQMRHSGQLEEALQHFVKNCILENKNQQAAKV